MLHKLTLKGFAVHCHREIDFEAGLTTITGPNGIGKSLIVEAVRYALFGTAALRGGHPEQVVLEFSVKGVRHRVTRNERNAKIEEVDGAVLSVGTKPTNLKIIELFGYGLDVFDVANCANQGLIEALSNMKPAERKRMVETTIGVDALEKLLGMCRQEALGKGKEADALSRGLGVAPERPTAPTDHRSQPELASEVTRLEREVSELREAERNLAAEPPSEVGPRPEVPELDPSVPLVDYEGADRREAQDTVHLREVRARMECLGIRLLPTPLPPEGEVEAYLDAVEFVDSHTQPSHTPEQLDEAERLHNDLEEFQRWARLHASGKHECPACNHTWPIEAGALAGLRDWHGKEAPAPQLSRNQIARSRSEIAAFERVREKYGECAAHAAKVLLTKPEVTKVSRVELRKHALEMTNYVMYQDLMQEDTRISRNLVRSRSYAIAYHAFTQATAEAASWDRIAAQFAAWVSQATGWRETTTRFGTAPAQLVTTRAAFMERQVYDRLYAAWEAAMAGRAEREAEIASLRATGEQWKEAGLAVGDVRQQIETTLVPGLAALSSMLVSRMTGGRRQQVAIDPGFALSLDNQDVDTLSGSEKAAVNLALRIALGRMLTARVFSVLILDEPDAAMDDERAGTTADCLRSLCPEIAQVILVTHKQIATDFQVVLN